MLLLLLLLLRSAGRLGPGDACLLETFKLRPFKGEAVFELVDSLLVGMLLDLKERGTWDDQRRGGRLVGRLDDVPRQPGARR